jgi:signal transduction histidine kinase
VRAYDERARLLPIEARMTILIPPRFFQTWWFRTTVGGAIALAGMLVLRARRRRARERRALLHAERARIARDLHDHLGQSLGAIGFLTDALHLGAAAQGPALVDKLRRVVRETRKGVNDLIWDLRAANEEGPDLVASLRQVVARASDQGATVRLCAPDASPRVTGLVLHEVPFLVSEAMTNAVRHGKARVIEVEIAVVDDRLRIIVADDGVGLGAAASDPASGGSGVLGMHERARRMGGELVIAPAQPTGTRVTLEVPLRS